MMDLEKALYTQGRSDALKVQREAPEMTGDQLYDTAGTIPAFSEAVKVKNMLARKPGFVCRSSAGRMVRLLQPYDSSIYNQEPEDLPAQWGFAWSQDPAHALPYVQIATSPYNTGDCCTWEDQVYRSLTDNNVYSPADYPAGWEVVA